MQKEYKIAMVGLGSIGKRHLQNIHQVLKKRNVLFTIDAIRRSINEPLNVELSQYITKSYTLEQEIPKDYDIIFITNPTHLHYQTIQNYIEHTRHMFIEKPVFDQTNLDIKRLNLKTSSIYYVACPLRYTKVIQYIKENIDMANIYSTRVICSSYLPEWRPNVDYRKTYSAHLNQGGGVSIDLIHEWDYLMYLFGKPEMVLNLRGKFSHLEIDSDDLSIYMAKYKKMLVEVHLDYLGRKPVREIQLFTKEDTIIADLIHSEIRYLKSGQTIRFEQERNDYQIREIENFFDIVEEKSVNENDINTALTTLKIAKEGIVE